MSDKMTTLDWLKLVELDRNEVEQRINVRSAKMADVYREINDKSDDRTEVSPE